MFILQPGTHFIVAFVEDNANMSNFENPVHV